MKKQILILPFFIFSLILLIFFYLLIIDRNLTEIPSNLIDKNVPKFQTKSLLKDEIFISSDKFKNQIVLVNFFATWCKPCRDEHKYITRFSNEKKIKIIGVNYKDNPQQAKQWLKKLGNPYSDIATDRDGRIAIDWGVYGIPETFIINSKGIIKYRLVGPVTEKKYNMINSILNNIK